MLYNCPVRAALEGLLLGQPEAIEAILSAVYMHQSGLGPEGHPIGVFLLLGPTGVGKTHTVESTSRALHGTKSNFIRMDCGELQLDHEVAKVVGAPPGYLGHRDTPALLSAKKLTSVTSPQSDISLVLFDEIEKSSMALQRLMLGILDHSELSLGDNSLVNFDNSMIFMTSNLGASKMAKLSSRAVGFEKPSTEDEPDRTAGKILAIGTAAIKKHFAPEFVNRIDSTIVYSSLSRGTCETILAAQIQDFRMLVIARLRERSFTVSVTEDARDTLLDQGVSREYGARELKRVVNKAFFAPVGTMLTHGGIPPGSNVTLHAAQGSFDISVKPGPLPIHTPAKVEIPAPVIHAMPNAMAYHHGYK